LAHRLSSNKLRRRSSGVKTRPIVSVLRTTSVVFSVFVIALCYDVYDPVEQKALGVTLTLEHFQKNCSRTGRRGDKAVFLAFWRHFGSVTGFFKPRRRRSLAKKPKILALSGYSIFSNALKSSNFIYSEKRFQSRAISNSVAFSPLRLYPALYNGGVKIFL